MQKPDMMLLGFVGQQKNNMVHEERKMTTRTCVTFNLWMTRKQYVTQLHGNISE